EVGGAPGVRQMFAYQALNQVELAALAYGRQVQVFQEGNLGLRNRHVRGANGRALIGRGQEGARVVLHAAVGARGTDGDEAGEVAVFRTQPVGDPRADGRADQVRCAGVQAQGRFAVRLPLGVQAANHAEVVRTGGDLRQQVGNPKPGRATLAKLPGSTKQRRGVSVSFSIPPQTPRVSG